MQNEQIEQNRDMQLYSECQDEGFARCAVLSCSLASMKLRDWLHEYVFFTVASTMSRYSHKCHVTTGFCYATSVELSVPLLFPLSR